jgi:transposase-like protein
VGVLAGAGPRHTRWAADALRAIFAMEPRESALARAEQVASETEERRPGEAARRLREGIGETTTCLPDDHPVEHRRRIRTSTMIERLNREIRRRTRVVGAFPDGGSALTPITAGIRYVTDNDWSTRRRPDMPRLGDTIQEANRKRTQETKPKVRKNSGTTPFSWPPRPASGPRISLTFSDTMRSS